MTRNTPTADELARDSALDDDTALHRALRIIQLFNRVYGRDKVTKRYLEELTDILIAVRQRARERHQEAERRRIEAQDEVAIRSQFR
jgi:hypothetical protein